MCGDRLRSGQDQLSADTVDTAGTGEIQSHTRSARDRQLLNPRYATTRFPAGRLLKSASAGFGYLALAGMLGQNAARRGQSGPTRWRPRRRTPRPRPSGSSSCSWTGAMSQLDTWEYKPQLQKDDGKDGPGGGTLTASKFKFSQHGQTGTWVSELFPNMARHVDKLCFLRGLHTDTPAHPQAVIQLHTGTALASLTRPSMGAWLLYGLGTENQDLPGYITINPPPNFGGAVELRQRLPAGPLPGHAHQRHRLPAEPEAADGPVVAAQAARPDPGDEPRPGGHARRPRGQVEGVIQSYELAFRMQGKVPELLDISREPQKVLDAYGVKPGPAGSFARQCLMARRLSEAGVRFVEICQPGWDHHSNLHKGLIQQLRAPPTSPPPPC